MYAHEAPSPEFRGLLRSDAHGALVPEAAWHWECDAGARRWSFHLRPDLCAPDTGARVTARSFEERWRAVSLLPLAGGLPRGQCRSLDSWKLVVLLDRPDVRLPHRLARSRLTLASRCLSDPLTALLSHGPTDGPALR
ncbi:hypothetical protein [Streptomyces sp. NPDC054975]